MESLQERGIIQGKILKGFFRLRVEGAVVIFVDTMELVDAVAPNNFWESGVFFQTFICDFLSSILYALGSLVY